MFEQEAESTESILEKQRLRYDHSAVRLPQTLEIVHIIAAYLFAVAVGTSYSIKIFLTPQIFFQTTTICFLVLEFIFAAIFLLRLYRAHAAGAKFYYFFYNGGWIDLLLSIVALLCLELPALLSLFTEDENLLAFLQQWLYYGDGFESVKILILVSIYFAHRRYKSYRAGANGISLPLMQFGLLVFVMLTTLLYFTDVFGVKYNRNRIVEKHQGWLFKFEQSFDDIEKNIQEFGATLKYQNREAKSLALKNFAQTLFSDNNAKEAEVVAFYYQGEQLVANYTSKDFHRSFRYFSWLSPDKAYVDARLQSIQHGHGLLVVNTHASRVPYYIFLWAGFIVNIFLTAFLHFYFQRLYFNNFSALLQRVNNAMRSITDNELIQVDKAQLYSDPQILQLVESYNKLYLPLKLEKIVRQRKKQIEELQANRFLK